MVLQRDLLLLATSGSSGTPKLVRVTVGNLVAQADTFRHELGFEPGARVLNLSPLVHVDGITGVFSALWTGSTLVRPGPFNVTRLPETLHALYRYRVTHALVVPTLLQLFLRLAEDVRAAFRTGDLRVVISTAAPLPDALWSAIEERTGIPLVNMFGLSETGNVLFTRVSEPGLRFTLGRAVDCRARVVDGDGAEVGDDVAGELEVQGPSVSPGYLDAPNGPWFATGDIVSRDSAGVFRLCGRKKNAIITGGRNVYPEEVDAALGSHPDVLEAVTVGVPDEVWGERVESCVVVRGAGASLDQIALHAAERLSPYKRPRALHRRESVPRGPSGKPLRPAIRDALIAAEASRAQADPAAALGSIETRVLAIAAEVLRVPLAKLGRTSAPGAPNSWDSLAHLTLVMRAEESFGIDFAPGEITRIDCLGRLIDLTAAKLTAGRER